MPMVPTYRRRMGTSSPAPRWAGITVWFLTIVWILAVLGACWWVFTTGFGLWAAAGRNAPHLEREMAQANMTLAAIAAGGPFLIVVVAVIGRRKVTAAVHFVLGMVIGLLLLPLAADAHHKLTPPPSPPGPAGFCQEHSGGDNTCPGG